MELEVLFSSENDCEDVEDIGMCRSWRKQQDNLSAYVALKSLRPQGIPNMLLAQFGKDTVTVYQAYNQSIAEQAIQNGNFANSEFSFRRMTWIKPNFSWMMHRSGWASKRNQETILAIRLRRPYFDTLLEQAVPTTWDGTSYGSSCEWHAALRSSNVLIQWDPDHHIRSSFKLPYRVLQLGIRGAALDGFKGSGIASITDITRHVRDIHRQGFSRPVHDPRSCDVATPFEKKYPISEDIQLKHRVY